MCDTVAVVHDGGVLFAKNSDRDTNEAQILDWQPRREHGRGHTVRCTWIEIPQAEQTRAVLLSRPFWMWGAEMGTNEHGVTIGNEAVFTRQPYERMGLTGMDLLRLGLERAETAPEAIEVMTALLATHGQSARGGTDGPAASYHSSFIVADPQSAFVLETAGREWAKEEVRQVRSISNALTIEGFARGQTEVIRTWGADARARRACTTRSARGATDAAAMMRVLRDHGPGREWPRYGPINGAHGAPCVHPGGMIVAVQTTGSWVADLRPDVVRHWVTATAAPCVGLFKPVSVGAPLDLGPAPDDHDDGKSLWWRHEALQRRVLRDPGRLASLFLRERDEIEARWLDDPPPSAHAFDEADAALRRWTDAVLREDPRDVRPVWARRACRRQNLRARLGDGPR